MAGPPTAAFGQVTWVFDGASVPHGAVTTLGVGWQDPAVLLPLVSDWWVDELSPGLASNVRLLEVRAKQGPVATGPTYVLPVAHETPGSAAAVPPNTSLLVSKRVDGVSQRLGGRFYWPGLPELEVGQGGSLNAGYRPGLQTAFDELWTALDTLSAEPLLFPSNSSDPRPVASFFVNAVTATQRRRLRR